MPDTTDLTYFSGFGIPDVPQETYNASTLPMGNAGTIPGSNTSQSLLSLLSQGIQTAGNIFSARYAVPQLNPGEYIQNKTGVYYQGNPTSGIPGSVNLTGSGGISPLLLIGGAGLILVLMLAKK